MSTHAACSQRHATPYEAGAKAGRNASQMSAAWVVCLYQPNGNTYNILILKIPRVHMCMFIHVLISLCQYKHVSIVGAVTARSFSNKGHKGTLKLVECVS